MCLDEFGIKKRIYNPLLNKSLEEILAQPPKKISIPENTIPFFKKFTYFPKKSLLETSDSLNRKDIIKGLYYKTPVRSISTNFKNTSMKKFLITASKKKSLQKISIQPSLSQKPNKIQNTEIISKTSSIHSLDFNSTMLHPNVNLRKLKESMYETCKAVQLKVLSLSGSFSSNDLIQLTEAIARKKES